ncbi:MAG: hypothetical protein AAGH48_07520 [Pseudomonadota bacterium]
MNYAIYLSNFTEDDELNDALVAMFDEAHHVHYRHPEMWKREARFKDRCAAQLALLMRENGDLATRLLTLKLRIVSMLVHRAAELLATNADIEALSKSADSVG